MDKKANGKHLYTATVELSASELSAVEAWREANAIQDRTEALRELIKFGLLSEIRRVYQFSERSRERIVSSANGRERED